MYPFCSEKLSPSRYVIGKWATMADRDFDEDEVWSVIGHKEKETALRGKKIRDASTTKKVAYSASRMIPKIGGSANSSEGRIVQQSAPVNIPDWSKVYKKSLKSPWGVVDDDDDENGSGASCYAHGFEDGVDNDDIEECDDDRLPPHEFIARKLAGNHITPSSVYEGVGRTLKGRDLKKSEETEQAMKVKKKWKRSFKKQFTWQL